MVLRKKPKTEEDFLLQASTVTEVQKEAEPEKLKIRKTELRFPENLYLTLERHLHTLDIKPSRNQWILMAIKEKLDRDSSQ